MPALTPAQQAAIDAAIAKASSHLPIQEPIVVIVTGKGVVRCVDNPSVIVRKQ